MNDSPPSTHERLVEAARTCVRRHGLAATTSREITSVAGANLASITYHFGSKEQLVAEALFDEIERRVRPALDVFDQSDDATTALLSVVQQLLAEFERSKDDAVVYLEALVLSTRDSEYRAQALDLLLSITTRLAALIAELQRDGVVPPWVEPAPMASLVLAVANGIVLQSELDPAGASPASMAGQFAGLLLAAAQQR